MSTRYPIHSEVLHSGRAFSIMRERWRMDAEVEEYDLVDHPGSALVIAMRNGHLVFVRQFRPAIRKEILEFPAGKIDVDELPQQAAQRELAEETGYTANRWRKFGIIFPSPGYTREHIHIYEARQLRAGEAHPDENENIAVETLTPGTVAAMIRAGVIQDAKTICAFHFWRGNSGSE